MAFMVDPMKQAVSTSAGILLTASRDPPGTLQIQPAQVAVMKDCEGIRIQPWSSYEDGWCWEDKLQCLETCQQHCGHPWFTYFLCVFCFARTMHLVSPTYGEGPNAFAIPHRPTGARMHINDDCICPSYSGYMPHSANTEMLRLTLWKFKRRERGSGKDM